MGINWAVLEVGDNIVYLLEASQLFDHLSLEGRRGVFTS